MTYSKYPTSFYIEILPTAYLVYGGHVSDSGDLEAVDEVCRICLQPPQSTWGIGPLYSFRSYEQERILKFILYENCSETKT